ncbi:MAG: NAD-dependent epimerase/dehydratase family protein [bacterium]|nr:NAD-dependent epimerase/dehydratase family protein [bacterium]
MRVFVTGATGYIGGTVVQHLLDAGHEVIGLIRSGDSARSASERLEAIGAEPHVGNLDDLDSIEQGVAAAEGVVHAAMSIPDYNRLDLVFAKERAVVEAMLSALAGTGQPFVYTSGAAVYEDTGDKVVDETDPADARGDVALRAALEQDVLKAAEHDVRSIVIRPGMVYGNGGSGIMHVLAGLVRQFGGACTVGDGSNAWSAIHVEDLADLYLGALEQGPAGSLFNAGTEDFVTMRDIASAIARTLDLEGPVTAWPVEEARGALGPMADALTTNKRMSSARARTALDWHPHHPGLIEEIESGSYPAAFAAS